MHLRRSPDTIIPDPDLGTVLNQLADLETNEFIALVRDEEHYIQASVDLAGDFDFEYREGGREYHYRTDFACTADQVADGLTSYRDGDAHWRTCVEWRRDSQLWATP